MSTPPKQGAAIARKVATPEAWLSRAMNAKTPSGRARNAQRGLATSAPLDKTTQAMLLRQLYLSYFETRHFEKALSVAEDAAGLGIDLTDILLQDAARAAVAAGDVSRAVEHLRAASRRAPPERRAFHFWTLGSVLFLAHRYDESVAALERAARWGTTDKPLYRGHLALVRLAAGARVLGLQAIVDELSEAACGQGYGRFVLGHLAYAGRNWPAARRYLSGFIKRTLASRPAMAIALEGELAMATATLAKMAEN